jgi:tripeptidyl-peptidase I
MPDSRMISFVWLGIFFLFGSKNSTATFSFLALLDFVPYKAHFSASSIICHYILFFLNKKLNTCFIFLPSTGSRLFLFLNCLFKLTVANHVDFVGGVSHFPSVKPMLQRRAMIQNAKKRVEDAVLNGNTDLWSLAVDPAFLRELYNIGSVQGKSSANRMAVAQFLEQYYSSLDLDEFFLLFWRNSIGQQPTVVGPNPSPAGTEASLDIEYIMSIGSQINTTFWSTSGRENNQEPFLQWMLAVNQLANPPYVFSVSYGDDEDTIPLSYTTRLNTEFMKAGARGISILFASGDDGVGGGGGSKCKKFVPNYPASSPYITAVGGTQSDGVFESGGEIVASLSGGGFSNYFGRPTYQAAAVENYLTEMKAKLPPQAKWNATGRAYPDVSAQAMDYVIVINLYDPILT